MLRGWISPVWILLNAATVKKYLSGRKWQALYRK
jgi:hypothetical protein